VFPAAAIAANYSDAAAPAIAAAIAAAAAIAVAIAAAAAAAPIGVASAEDPAGNVAAAAVAVHDCGHQVTAKKHEQRRWQRHGSQPRYSDGEPRCSDWDNHSLFAQT
jgi:hypothetical protein